MRRRSRISRRAASRWSAAGSTTSGGAASRCSSRHRQHVVDVYVQPAGERPAAPYTTVSQGYALDRWNAAGMTWWAVTDAEPSALAAFRTALDARLAGTHNE